MTVRPAPLAISATTTFPAPASVHGATKLARERILGAWANSLDVARAVHAAATVAVPPSGPADIGSGEHQAIALVARLIAGHHGAPAPR